MSLRTFKFSVIVLLTLLFGFILLLNFGAEAFFQSAQAQNNAQTNTNINSSINLGASDSFDPDAIPYFQSQTADPFTTTTITITNKWTKTITAHIRATDDRTIIETHTCDSATSTQFTITTSESVDLSISADDKDGFREWDNQTALVIATGDAKQEFESYSRIPDIRYFTTDSSGTEAGNFFFAKFFVNSSATSLPEGSFDLSTITKVKNSFFWAFNQNGNLKYLPAGSFDTSNIQEASDNFFYAFNLEATLTSLPVGSFNFDALESHGNTAFRGFNQSGSLTSLPYNSFYLKNVDICDTDACDTNSWNNFNAWGALTKEDSGIAIRNTSYNTQAFYSSNEVEPDGVASGSTFNFYKSDPAPSPSPTPTTSPTESPTASPTPTKSPTSSASASPSSSNSLPATGDDSGNIFTFGGTSLLLAIISLAIYYLKRRSKTSKK